MSTLRPLRLADVRSALAATLVAPAEPVTGPTAAVAAVLRQRDGGRVELLFIRRAKRRGDPWSGHIAWPGGKREACDETMEACAVRETREEVALDLRGHATLIGALRPLRFDSPRHTRLRAVFAYVFVLEGDPELRLSDEVQEAIWIPLEYFTEWPSRRPWRWLAGWLPATPPAFRYQGKTVWGLTLWLLRDLLDRLR
jgi:ADP-ribose pyrophosphatase YjhB (NUDIX family)